MTPSFWTCAAWPERFEAEFISENPPDSEINDAIFLDMRSMAERFEAEFISENPPDSEINDTGTKSVKY
jgi:hypothetical protein